jgi:hypothetical protein
MNLIFRVMIVIMAMLAYAAQQASAQGANLQGVNPQGAVAEGAIASLGDGQYNYCSLPKPDWAGQVPPAVAAIEASPGGPPAVPTPVIQVPATTQLPLQSPQPPDSTIAPGDPPGIPIVVLPAEPNPEPGPVLAKSMPDLPASSIDTSLLHYLSQTNAVCFEFQKQGDHVRGILNSPGAYGTDGIHVEGTAANGLITGRAVQVFVDGAAQVRKDPIVPIQNVQDYWNNKAFIKLNQAQFQDAEIPLVIYDHATLNLSEFYAY